MMLPVYHSHIILVFDQLRKGPVEGEQQVAVEGKIALLINGSPKMKVSSGGQVLLLSESAGAAGKQQNQKYS